MRLDLMAQVCPGLEVPVFARLGYRGADPFAVYLDCHVDLPESTTWVFSREILAVGVHRWAGIGSVTVHPAPGRTRAVCIVLRGAEGTAVLRAPAAQVEAFLERTWQIVPQGCERGRLDLDGLLHDILGDGSRRAAPTARRRVGRHTVGASDAGCKCAARGSGPQGDPEKAADQAAASCDRCTGRIPPDRSGCAG